MQALSPTIAQHGMLGERPLELEDEIRVMPRGQHLTGKLHRYVHVHHQSSESPNNFSVLILQCRCREATYFLPLAAHDFFRRPMSIEPRS